MAFISFAPLRTTSFAGTLAISPRSAPYRFVSPKHARVTMCEQSSQEAPQPPDGTTITKSLEVSFRAVWVTLLTAGANEQYTQAILQFVVTCATAYKAGYSLRALQLELMANEIGGKDEAGVDTRLNDREKQTRLIWMTLVYLTLKKFKFESVNPPPPVDIDLKGTEVGGMLGGLTNLVDQVCEAAKKGYDLAKFKMELSLSDRPVENEADAAKANAQKNLRSQWSRIVFTTVGILPDSTKGFTSPKLI